MSIRFITPVHLYEIQETLGESQFSTVYLAWRRDKKLKIKQTLIIKVFKTHSPIPILQMESLLRARHSSHLVKALFFEQFQSQPALILEYISGVNLKQFIKNQKLDQNEVNCICSQVLSGLEELKKNGLAHGDLSLSNILIDTSGRVYLTDYGLANYEGSSLYTTKPFTAPELYTAHKPCFSSDLFSLGVLEKVLNGHFTEKELTTLESKNFILEKDLLLDPDPKNRRKKTFPFSSSAGSRLGTKVQQMLLIKSYFPPAKNNPLPLKTKERKKYHFISMMGTLLLFVFTVNPFHSYSNYTVINAPAEVLVRTQNWIHIQMSGRKGYSPLNIQVNTPGFYKMIWKNKKSKGSKYLYLKSGQTITLRDNDFP